MSEGNAENKFDAIKFIRTMYRLIAERENVDIKLTIREKATGKVVYSDDPEKMKEAAM